MISEHAENWLGFPVKLFDFEIAEKGISDFSKTIYRLALDWDAKDDFATLFSKFMSYPASVETPAIIIGQYHGEEPELSSEEVVQLLVSARFKLPNLRGIFIGDMISEENEVSWINQSNILPLVAAYPNLEHLRLRGTNQLSFGGRLFHTKLKSLVVETGGLPLALFKEVMASELPALENLELWLGTDAYGGDVTVKDLDVLLSGSKFPALKRLGLRNSEIVDAIAATFHSAGILSRIEELDLSLGTLSDAGGKAILGNSALKRLKRLDLHRHYLSTKMMGALKQEFPNANLDEPEGDVPLDDRYVSVSE